MGVIATQRQYIEGYCQPGTQTFYLNIQRFVGETTDDQSRFYSITPDANGYWRWYVPQGKKVLSLRHACSRYSQANSDTLVSIDFSHIDPVISFEYTFGYYSGYEYPCTNLKSVKGMRIVSDNSMSNDCFNGTFYGCSSLEYVDVHGWKNTTRATTIAYLFRDCTSLTTLDGQDEWALNLTTSSAWFRNCQNIEELDFSNFTGGTAFNNYWFYNCYKLKRIKSWGNLHFSATTMQNNFNNCYALEEIDLSVISGSTPTSFAGAFNNCTSLEEIDLSSLGTCQVTNMQTAFSLCDKLKSVFGLDKLDVTNCTSFVSMCAYSKYLEDFDIHTWKPTVATLFNGCFRECYALKLNASTVWDVSGATATSVDYMYASGSIANQNAWAAESGRTPWADFTHLSIPTVDNGATTTNFAQYHYGNDVVSTCGNISESLSFSSTTLDLPSAILILQHLQDVTGYGGETLTFSTATRALIAADATAMSLVQNARDNLGWTITI